MGSEEERTIFEAWGSALMFASAQGEELPRHRTAPPITTTFFKFPGKSGARSNATAKSVSGPVVTRVSSPAYFRADWMRNSAESTEGKPFRSASRTSPSKLAAPSKP